MSTIDTSVLSQIPTKTSGREKTQSDDGGKGEGRFSDAFASVAAKDGYAAPGDRRIPAQGEHSDAQHGELSLKQQASTFGADPLLLPDGAELPTRHGEGSASETAETGRTGRRRLSIERETSLSASGHSHPTAVDDRSGEKADGDKASDYDNLLSMLGDAAQAEPGRAGGADATSAPSLSAAAAALAQIDRPRAKTADAGPHEAIARRTIEAAERGRGEAVARAETAADEAAASDSAEADQVFRLIRSDGKAKPVEIAISGNGDIAAKDQSTSPARIDAVTVLDARRYLGLAQPGNTAAVTAAIAQDPSWASALSETADKLPDMTGKVVNTLKIQLTPIDLGTVTATLRLQGEALVVDLKVETGKAFRNLSDDQDAIVKALRGHGFSVDQISIQLSSSADRSGGAGQGDGQAQFSGQQQAREGGGRQSGGEARYSGSLASNEGSAHDLGHADSLNGAGQRSGAGGVYL